MHMQNIICKVEYISCLSIFLLISFLYILLQAICTARLSFLFLLFTNLFFLIFLRNYYEQVCRCKSDLCIEHCKFEFMALLITHSIENDVQSLPLLERSRSFDFKWKRKQLPLWDISTGYLYGISSLVLFLANGADQFFWFCAVFSLRFYTKNNLRERSDCNQMSILMMLFLLPDLDIPRCNCNSE